MSYVPFIRERERERERESYIISKIMIQIYWSHNLIVYVYGYFNQTVYQELEVALADPNNRSRVDYPSSRSINYSHPFLVLSINLILLNSKSFQDQQVLIDIICIYMYVCNPWSPPLLVSMYIHVCVQTLIPSPSSQFALSASRWYWPMNIVNSLTWCFYSYIKVIKMYILYYTL